MILYHMPPIQTTTITHHKGAAAVLVAISIPIFTNQLERSKEATDLANIRAAYAAAVTTVLETNADASATAPAAGQRDTT